MVLVFFSDCQLLLQSPLRSQAPKYLIRSDEPSYLSVMSSHTTKRVALAALADT